MTRIISFVSLVLIILGLISATVVERLLDTGTAFVRFYYSPWMIALWAICAVTALAVVIARRRGMTAATLSLHLSLIIILAGAAVTHFFGEHGLITLHTGVPATSFTLSDGSVRQLPFTVSLTDCGAEYYPGTHSACDYFSTVTIDSDTLLHHISMNHTLDIRGYRFCQSGLGDDTSTLSVNHDPWGIGITFTGYGMLFLSMFMALISRKGRFRIGLRRLATAVMIASCSFPSASAASHDTPATLQRPLAKTLGTLYLSDNGRIRPLQSFARDFCITVYGKDSYKRLTPEQVLAGWIFYYDTWKHEPMIRLKSPRARKAMGGATHVSLAALYSGGSYRLQSLLDISGGSDRDLTADDNRVALVTALCTGSALSTIPVKTSDGALTWYSWADDIPADNDTLQSVALTLSTLYRDISHGHFRHANTQLLQLRSLQQSIGGTLLPSSAAIRAERLYNISFHPLLSAIATLLTGIFALLAYLYGIRHTRLPLLIATWGTFVYTTYIVILRWIAGGHIPLATGYETMLALAWIAMLLSLWGGQRITVIKPLGYIVAGTALLVAMMGSNSPSIGTLMPVLGSRLLSLHVMLVMTSYALLAIIALAAAIGLASPVRRDHITLLSTTLLIPALFLLGAGIFVGAIWANQSWGRYWGWDPKETWALVTFFIYAIPLHQSLLPYFRSSRHLLTYLLLAFLSVIMTYLGVNYLLSGLHSYGAA